MEEKELCPHGKAPASAGRADSKQERWICTGSREKLCPDKVIRGCATYCRGQPPLLSRLNELK